LDGNQVLILRPSEKFLTWEIPSTKDSNLSSFQLFILDYLEAYLKGNSIKASELNKFKVEINEAWSDSEKIRKEYSKFR